MDGSHTERHDEGKRLILRSIAKECGVAFQFFFFKTKHGAFGSELRSVGVDFDGKWTQS